LGSVPPASARSLRSGCASAFGLMLAPLPPSPFVPIVHEAVTAAITGTQRRGKLVLPFADPGEGDEDTAYVDRVMADVDLAGVICELAAHNLAAGRRLHDLDVPVVWMSLASTVQRPPGIAHVMVDQAAGWSPLLDSLEVDDDKEIAVLVGPMFRPARLDLVAERFPGAPVCWRPPRGCPTPAPRRCTSCWPTTTTSGRSSAPTTHWPTARCSPCAAKGSTCPARSPWWASAAGRSRSRVWAPWPRPPGRCVS